MNWEKLNTFECPYCECPLKHGEGVISCTVCAFVISPERFEAIRENRGKPKDGRAVPAMHWENLHDWRCPLDGEQLKDNAGGPYAFMQCIKPGCTFKIRDDKRLAILADPYHPANYFRKSQ